MTLVGPYVDFDVVSSGQQSNTFVGTGDFPAVHICLSPSPRCQYSGGITGGDVWRISALARTWCARFDSNECDASSHQTSWGRRPNRWASGVSHGIGRGSRDSGQNWQHDFFGQGLSEEVALAAICGSWYRRSVQLAGEVSKERFWASDLCAYDSGYRAQVRCRPPSTGIVTPVQKPASSDSRKSARSATSSGLPIRPMGWVVLLCSTKAA